MKKNKILTVIGTRPEIIRLSSIINKLDKNFTHLLLNTNQNFDKNLNKVFFDNFQLKKPKYFMKNSSKNPLEFITLMFKFIDKIIKKEKPDGFLVLGDTNSCLSSYIAKKNQIPIFHLEAGNRSFDPRVPEEINRKLVDHLSDINICYSNNSRQNLIREGYTLENVFVCGSPLNEVFINQKKLLDKSNIINKLKLFNKRFILVSIHREENLKELNNLNKIFKFISNYCKKNKLKAIISLHPKTKDKISKYLKTALKNKNFIFHKPFDFFDYCTLQKKSKFTISDSGSISEESYMQNFPAINIRDSHERSEAMDQGTVIMSGFSDTGLERAIAILVKQNFSGPKTRGIKIHEYDEVNVSDKIVNLVESYIDYLKIRKWYK